MTVFCSTSMGEFPDRRKLRASDQEATGEPLDWCCVVRFVLVQYGAVCEEKGISY